LQLFGAAFEGLAPADDATRLVPDHIVGIGLSDG
jgi:hypothetical protein